MRTLVRLGVVLALALVASAGRAAPLDRWLEGMGRPFVIGIAGDSGSGKSTFAEAVQRTLGADRVKIVCVDDYHRLDREGRKRAGVTALDPVATDLGRLAGDLAALRQGRAIQKQVYDHATGRLAAPVPFAPAPIIIVEGLHPFATEALRGEIDLGVYFEASSRVKEGWKIKRDVTERGHSLEALRKEMRARKPDFKKFVEPQRGLADVLVHFDWSKGGTVGEDLRVRLSEKGLQVPSRRLRVNASGAGFVLRGERRRDGTGVILVDGRPPATTLWRENAFLRGSCGISPTVEPRSLTLDAARVLVADRAVREIAKLGGGRPARVPSLVAGHGAR